MGEKHPGSSDGLGEYGVSRESVRDHSGGNHSGKEGHRRAKSNMAIQGKAIRLSRPDMYSVVARALYQLKSS